VWTQSGHDDTRPLYCVVLCGVSGDIDDLLELLFPDDNELSFKQLHTQDPATITSRLATRGKAATTALMPLHQVCQSLWCYCDSTAQHSPTVV
jgi:hypothetical protein